MGFLFGKTKSKPSDDETKAKAKAAEADERAEKKEVVERRRIAARTKSRVTGGQRQLMTDRGPERAAALGNPEEMPLRASLGPRSGHRG